MPDHKILQCHHLRSMFLVAGVACWMQATTDSMAAQPANPWQSAQAQPASPDTAGHPPTDRLPAPPTDSKQAPSAAPPPKTPETPAVVVNSQQVESILGKKVRSSSGDDMGRIVDIIADKTGQLRAAIIDFGGFLGVGSKQIAVDWKAIRFSPDTKADAKTDAKIDAVTVDLTRDQLRVAPAYKPGEQIVILGQPSAATNPPPPTVAPAPQPPAPPAPPNAQDSQAK